jgi:hypothetical protein
MGLIELIIVVLLIMWALGYFGRGRWYATGPAVSTTGWSNYSLIHLILVLAVILLILRILRLA